MTETATNKIKISTWITIVSLVTGLAVVAALYWNKHITIQEVMVNDTYFTNKEDVYEIASYAIGVSPDSLDLLKLVHSIKELNYVSSVIPFVEPSGVLRLQVTERQPLALLVNGSERMYVDHEGVKLPILQGKTQNVPLVYGFNAHDLSDTLTGISFTQVRNFLMEAKKNGFGWTTISEVAFIPEKGVVAMNFQNGVKMIFGKGDFRSKLQNWKAFYAQVVRVKGIEHVQQVDLRFTNQVITHEI